jgi:pimeloyl-ACP methyl ester carboxylesterase
MEITRHFVDVGPRRVHYRRCGHGPILLMVHQSPRSSAEYTSLMRDWGQHFTCIAPDTPGFGQSEPLTVDAPTIHDYADALVDLLDALGLGVVGAYGFHSGGMILVSAIKRHPDRFTAIAAGGYSIWTAAENALLGDAYLPPLQPQPYGEHLAWLWNRMIEQSWFFPWFAASPQYRLPNAHANVAHIAATVRDMLASGDNYRIGYGAVLRAPRDIPPPDAIVPPALITAYNGDPLQAHIDRLGEMPVGWHAAKLATPADHYAASLDFLRRQPAPMPATLGEAGDAGFVRITTAQFDGLIHWRGRRGGPLRLPAPGSSAELTEPADGVVIDVPGHGLSDDWPGTAPTDWPAWQAVADTAAGLLDGTRIILSPDRFGSYLTRAWAIVRARHFFDPWYDARAGSARAFTPDDIAPERLAREHHALIQATAARAYLIALTSSKGDM